MNTLLTSQEITDEAIRCFENNLVAAKHVDKKYSNKFFGEGAKKGQHLQIRKPIRPIVSDGAQMVTQDATETFYDIYLDRQKHVGMNFTSIDRTLYIEQFSERFIVPAAIALANQVDVDVLELYKKFWNAVGTPGTTPATALVILQAKAKLNDNATPIGRTPWPLILEPTTEITMVDALKGLFQQSAEIARQYLKGAMGLALGFEWFMSQNTSSHTVGTYGGTPLVNGASQTGASLITDGWTATTTTLNEGDVFTIAGVYMVNPVSYRTNGRLQQFRVTAATVTDGSGNSTIAIEPSIIIAGPFQTVNAVPANDAAITVLGASTTVSPQNLAFFKEAIALVTADLVLPRGADMASVRQSPKTGVSMRIWQDRDIFNDAFPIRLDILYGLGVPRPEWGVRICG